MDLSKYAKITEHVLKDVPMLPTVTSVDYGNTHDDDGWCIFTHNGTKARVILNRDAPDVLETLLHEISHVIIDDKISAIHSLQQDSPYYTQAIEQLARLISSSMLNILNNSEEIKNLLED